jgi:hypothetical protein
VVSPRLLQAVTDTRQLTLDQQLVGESDSGQELNELTPQKR